MKYALLIALALASTATAQCSNCQVRVQAPQTIYTTQKEMPTLAPMLPVQTYSIVETQLPLFARMAVRAEGRQAARSVRQTGRGLSYASYPAVTGVTSGGSTGAPVMLSYGSTGTPTTYSLGSTGTPAVSQPTISYGSTGTPTVTAAPVCTCSCPGCICNQSAPAAVSYAVSAAPITYAAPMQSANYLIALRSATERARLGIKGHLLSIERLAGRAVGVGWSSHNPNPATCFNNRPGDYAVARGRDGYYATKIVY